MFLHTQISFKIRFTQTCIKKLCQFFQQPHHCYRGMDPNVEFIKDGCVFIEKSDQCHISGHCKETTHACPSSLKKVISDFENTLHDNCTVYWCSTCHGYMTCYMSNDNEFWTNFRCIKCGGWLDSL
jgi:hypothetical protein